MKITKHIPNFITLLNLTSGLIALLYIFRQNWTAVFLFVMLGIFFDFFDGLAARSFKVSSPLGLQLDSLADMVTSGVVPGFVLSFLLADSLGVTLTDNLLFSKKAIWALSGLIVTLASAYRLAKFNIDERQTSSFIGLPTPANALFIVSLPVIVAQNKFPSIVNLLQNPYILTAIAVISAYLLNAELSLFSLKFKSFDWQNNWQKYLLILLSIILLLWLQIAAIPLIIILYIFISLIPIPEK